MELRQVEVRLKKGGRHHVDGKMKVFEAEYTTGAFHCWEHYKDETFSGIWAIVELEDGSVKQFEVMT